MVCHVVVVVSSPTSHHLIVVVQSPPPLPKSGPKFPRDPTPRAPNRLVCHVATEVLVERRFNFLYFCIFNKKLYKDRIVQTTDEKK